MYKLTRCALCGSENDLELSHIVPKMVVRMLKKTAAGNIRNSENPNVPLQDSEKHYLLCGKCEDLFSAKERYFANTIFHPYIKKDKTKFDYKSDLFYFFTSLSWRGLYLDLLDFVENHEIGIDALEHLISCESIMKNYLLNTRDSIDSIEHHLFFFDEIKEIVGDNEITELRPHATFHRGIISYTFCYENEGTYGTITNMMGIALITLYRKGDLEKWEHTQIQNNIGRIEAKGQRITSVVGNEFTFILKATQLAFNNMSEKQLEKINANFENMADKIKNYPIFTDLLSDYMLRNK